MVFLNTTMCQESKLPGQMMGCVQQMLNNRHAQLQTAAGTNRCST
jgi:hypothetical protein